MGERITFRRNEGLITVKPYWRGNPVVKGRFVNRQHRSKQGIGNVLKWRFSPIPHVKRNGTKIGNLNFFHCIAYKGLAVMRWLG